MSRAIPTLGVVLGLALAMMVSLVSAPAALASTCPSLYVIGVRGSGEHSGYGRTIGSVVSTVKSSHIAGIKDDFIDYPAVEVGYGGWNHYLANYESSVASGKQAFMVHFASFIDGPCGGITPIVLAGYSQGAHIVGDEYQALPAQARARVIGVALIGDPRFRGSESYVNYGDYDPQLVGIYPSTRTVPRSMTGVLRSYCSAGDPICNRTVGNIEGCKVHSNTCVHSYYWSRSFPGTGVTYTQAAGNFLVSRYRAWVQAHPSVGSSGQSGSGGDAPSGAGSSSPGTGGSTPGGSGSASAAGPAAPAQTYAETAGGVAHTWTNYSNAGGTQGPSIGGGQTVQIACWVSGFRVADGNTYWYEIASSPWNDAYFVSADAFYNNGATSGTLSGTPFVDSVVPQCGSGGNASGGSKPTFAETAGGVAHTWTNYSNAGGTQGPSIGGGQTVQIACWVSGFRVADGNTYWYEIASSPWNDAYFVSADAFYNNGATSGSLVGTPFIDPAVPNCDNNSGGANSGPKPSWAETAGGVAHTWTNYSNAGGTQGPSIGGGQTVQIACWVSGFRVADGNTYWYEIASSPWNDAYFVSADAFYNNGARSGSLVGTPFIDPAVPRCS